MPNDPKCPTQFESVHNMIKICKTSACAGICTLQFLVMNIKIIMCLSNCTDKVIDPICM